MARATNQINKSPQKDYLYLLMHLEASPLDPDSSASPTRTRPTIAESYDTSQIATFSARGTDPKEAFKRGFTIEMEDEESNMSLFVGDAFNDNCELFVWVFDTIDRAWLFLGEIKAEKITSYDLID